MTYQAAEFWVIVLPVLASALVSIINAFKIHDVRRQVTPPSNGKTLGQLTESNVNASTVAAIESTRIRQSIDPHADDVPAVIPAAPLPSESRLSNASATEQPTPTNQQDQPNPDSTLP